MKSNKQLGYAGAVIASAVAFLWLYISGPDDAPENSDDRSMTWVESGPFEVGVGTVPAVPRVGRNELIVKVRMKDGTPAGDVRVTAYAEMAAMASMPAMRSVRFIEGRLATGGLRRCVRGEFEDANAGMSSSHGASREEAAVPIARSSCPLRL